MNNVALNLRHKSARLALALFQAVALCGGTMITAVSPALADVNPGGAPATRITGTVFQDFNSNGVMDTSGALPNMAVDVGVAGVTASAYISGSATAVASATTDASGAYTLTGLTAGVLYRIEFTTLPTGFEPASIGSSGSTITPSNASSVQFASAGTSNVSFGVNKPCDYCQNNPPVAINAFLQGDTTNVSNWSTSIFQYRQATDRDGNVDGTTSNAFVFSPVPTAPVAAATGAQTGNTYGLAWSRTSNRIFTSAYMKRGVGYGPGGPGGIYVMTPGGAPNGSLFVDLDSLFPGSMAPDTHNFTLGGSAPNQFVINDAAAADLVGKNAFGDIELSQDEAYLYAVNLFDRRLYRIPTSGPLNASTITSYPIPTSGGLITDAGGTGAGTCPAADVRPFALGTDRAGELYVGAVCSAQTTGNADGLAAYVWRFNQTTGAFTLVLANNPFNNYGGFAAWNNSLGTNNSNWSRQPMLVDIEFDNEAMLLGIRGRNADISIPWDPSGNQTYVRSNGDLLIACPTGATFAIEPAGYCGGRVSNNPGTWTYTGSTGNTYTVTEPGPTNGRSFYWGDQSGDGDEEALSGALAQVPGYRNVMANAFDPTYRSTAGIGGRCNGGNSCNANTGGVQIFSNRTGEHLGSYEAYGLYPPPNGRVPFAGHRSGKLAGIGDIEPLCMPAPIEIGNYVWDDQNKDGVQDPGEPGIAGVVVSLTTPSGVITTTTDASGFYVFKNEGASGPYSTTLRPTTAYTLTIDPLQTALLPYVLTVPNAQAVSGSVTSNNALLDVRDSDASNVGGLATIYYTTGTAGQNNHGLDFGFYKQPAQFGDRVWIESDTDGNANTGTLTPVAGMVITATSGANVYTTTTNADGYYSFTVPAGTYTVNYGPVPASYGPVVVSGTPAGATTSGNAGSYAQAGNPDQARPNGVTVTVAAGQANWTVDFAFTSQLLYDLGNRVWFDTNNNGLLDSGEQPVPGVLMQLRNVTGTVLGTTTTDANGYYSFTNLAAGNYIVTVAAVNFGATGVLRDYTSSDGATAPSNNAADNNKDHGIDPANRAAYLTNGVSSGLITLGPGLPTGEDAGSPATPNGDANNNQTIDFGFYRMSLGNRVWIDANNNGVIDPDEAPVAGATVTLYAGDGTTVISTTTTDAGGYYTFTALAQGDYVVGVMPPAGFVSSSGPGEEANPNANGDNNDNGVATMPSGEIRSGVITMSPGAEPDIDGATGTTNNWTFDFGIWQPASLGNYVWRDDNRDGVQNEPAGNGVNGVTVRLLDSNGNVVSTTVTANDPLGAPGYYTFTNLVSGTYRVEFVLTTLPPGATPTGQDAGSDDARDSDADPITGQTALITINAGEAIPTIDMGIQMPVGLGDYVWFDVDKNGQQNAGEPPVSGVTVTLYSGGQVVSTTVTNSSGYYQFVQLQPNTPYTLSFALPDGYVWTTPGTTIGGTTDSNVNADGVTAPVTLAPGEFNGTIDAGIISPLAIDKSATGSGASNTIGSDGLITYTLSVRNTSAQLVSNVMISDPLPSGVTYVAGSSQPAEVGTAPLTWRLAQIAPNGVATITFVVATSGVPAATIRNVAYAMQGGQVVAQDSADILARPTAVSLDLFEAVIGADGAQTIVRWSTALELNTLGFNVWRSTTSSRADAVKVNATLIAAKGASGGRYEIVDSVAGAYYWLEERELNGTVNWYGPVALGAPAQAAATIRVETVASPVLIPAQGVAPVQPQSIVKVEAAPVAPRAAANAEAIVVGPVALSPAGQVAAQPQVEAPGAASPVIAGEPDSIVTPAKPDVAQASKAAASVEETTVNGRVAEPGTLRVEPRAVVSQPAPAASIALPIALAAAALFGLLAVGCVGVVMLRRRK